MHDSDPGVVRVRVRHAPTSGVAPPSSPILERRHIPGEGTLYLLQLSDRLGIDPLQAAREKLAINAQKYPADKARGSSRKYTEL